MLVSMHKRLFMSTCMSFTGFDGCLLKKYFDGGTKLLDPYNLEYQMLISLGIDNFFEELTNLSYQLHA